MGFNPRPNERRSAPKEIWMMTARERQLKPPVLPPVDRSGKPTGHCGLLKKEVEDREEIELMYILDRNVQGFGHA